MSEHAEKLIGNLRYNLRAHDQHVPCGCAACEEMETIRRKAADALEVAERETKRLRAAIRSATAMMEHNLRHEPNGIQIANARNQAAWLSEIANDPETQQAADADA